MGGKTTVHSFSINMVMSIAARIVTLVAGLLVQRKILIAYGSILNGLTSSITQVMSYMILLEAGLGTASIQALYGPLAAEDWPGISEIFTATGQEYRRITATFIVLLAGVSVTLPLAVSGEVEYATAGLLTFITGCSYVISYVLGGKYKAVLSADRKMYVLYNLDILSTVLSCLLRVLALDAGAGIVSIQCIHLLSIFIKNSGYYLYVRKKYPQINYGAPPNFQAISKRWNVLVHSIAGIVVNHTDIMMLTLFAGLKTVSLYSVYNLVFSQLSTLLQTTFLQAPQSTFGKLYNGDKNQFNAYFGAYETLFLMLLHLICAVTIIMILPFVSVYTRNVSDIAYVDPCLAFLFTGILLLNQVRVPVIMMVNISGSFKETQRGAVLEAVINLMVSSTLFFLTDLGIYGLLIGTVCSYLYRTTDIILYTYKHLVKRQMSILIRTLCTNFFAMTALYVIFCLFFPIHTRSFGEWVIQGCMVSFASVVVFFLCNIVLNRQEMQKLRNLALKEHAVR